jgi:Arc/MetJ-type ribon-helix-helix transcriptional regulator
MTIHLPEHVERSIHAAVQSGRFPSVDEAVAAAWLAFEQPRQAVPQPPAAGQEQRAASPQSILDMVDELRKQVPPEEFSKLPTDGAKQLDHYLYGSPKRPTA